MRCFKIRSLAASLAVACLVVGSDAASQPAVGPNDANSNSGANSLLLTLPSLYPPAATPAQRVIQAPQPATPPGKYLGQLSANPYAADSTSNRFGKQGNPYATESLNNRYGPYGSAYSNQSATNPHATDAPKLYDSQGNYRGKLSANRYDPDSISNPYGRYGNPYSSDSIKNRYGAGNPYSPDSPTNPYGKGLSIYDTSGEQP